MQDYAQGFAVDRERESAQGPNVSATRRSRRRWSAEEKARVVRESLRPGSASAKSPGATGYRAGSCRLGAASHAKASSRWRHRPSRWVSNRARSRRCHARGGQRDGSGWVGCDRGAGGDGASRRRYRRFAGRGDCLGAAGASMNVAGTGMRVVVATRPVDFRKGHDGLAAVVEHELGLDPYSGVAVVFRPSGSTESRCCGGTGRAWCSHRSVWSRAGSPGLWFATG